MYPPHHVGGYELVWQGAVRALREAGHRVRILTTDFRLLDAADLEEHEVHRDLRWYWRDHRFPRLSPWAGVRLERHNAEVLQRPPGRVASGRGAPEFEARVVEVLREIGS